MVLLGGEEQGRKPAVAGVAAEGEMLPVVGRVRACVQRHTRGDGQVLSIRNRVPSSFSFVARTRPRCRACVLAIAVSNAAINSAWPLAPASKKKSSCYACLWCSVLPSILTRILASAAIRTTSHQVTPLPPPPSQTPSEQQAAAQSSVTHLQRRQTSFSHQGRQRLYTPPPRQQLGNACDPGGKRKRRGRRRGRCCDRYGYVRASREGSGRNRWDECIHVFF